ncbi:HAD-IIIA family hydrolase [Clostridium thailandense]|uniref:HAD-IIIA family hydrolase n=1 Tax=Clostridium thailandense TaxID=2794346 RepID=UPI0039894CAC
MKEKIQAIFIDRDGTIGGTDEVIYPGDFQLFSFTKEAISILKERKIMIFSFSNQPGISRGEAYKEDFIKELNSFGFDDVYICPHRDGEGCKCRKPETGLLEIAAAKNNLNLQNCVVIGDRWSDMLAAAKVGAVKILVLTGAGKDAIGKYRDKWLEYEPNYIAQNILEAVRWLKQEAYI